MKTIKFRAWHKEIKEMFQVGQITLEKGIWDYEPDDRKNIGVSIPYQPSFILMQYTGLHDKNGKEIYEGDIVKVRKWSSFETEVVKFDKGCFYAGMHYGSSTRTTLKLIQPKMTEVIGNIYENKELLNETDR